MSEHLTPERKAAERADQLMAKCRRRQSASLADIESLKNDVHDLAAEVDRLRGLAEMYREHSEHYRDAANTAQWELKTRPTRADVLRAEAVAVLRAHAERVTGPDRAVWLEAASVLNTRADVIERGESR